MIGGPSSPTSAFVSNIPAGCPDDLLASILGVFGMEQWRRLKEPSGALKPSGFADFSSAELAQQAARLIPLIDIYGSTSGKRLIVKLDTSTTSAIACAESGQGEEGELMDVKESDCRALHLLVSLFQQRRMLHAVDSCNELIRNYDRLVHEQATGEGKDDDFVKMEREWLTKETQIFSAYHEYLARTIDDNSCDADEMESLFAKDRPRFRKTWPDRDYEEHVCKLVELIPSNTADLFAHPIDYQRLNTEKLVRWLIRQRGLAPQSAFKVVSWFARRLTPEQMCAQESLQDGLDMTGFVVRLWRWLSLDTAL